MKVPPSQAETDQRKDYCEKNHPLHCGCYGKPRTVRYYVRPKSTIRGWYIWAVMLKPSSGHNSEGEIYAPFPHMTVNTKREAKAICASLNSKLRRKGAYRKAL